MDGTRIYVIEVSEDGEVSLAEYSEAGFMNHLDSIYEDTGQAPIFIDRMPKPCLGDLASGDLPFGALLVIRGEIMRPTAVKVETRWKL